jgi:hypothetical protein
MSIHKYDKECITNATEIKFLGLTIDDTLYWKQHIEQQIVLCMLRIEKYKTYSTSRHTKSNLFRTYTLYYKLWYNFWGELLLRQQSVYNPKEKYQNYNKH